MAAIEATKKIAFIQQKIAYLATKIT